METTPEAAPDSNAMICSGCKKLLKDHAREQRTIPGQEEQGIFTFLVCPKASENP